MADIFLSYAREDLAKAERLANALEKLGWSVFWDRSSILAGEDFEEVIEVAIDAASCMIVAWSEASKRSDWVRGEAQLGREQKKLVPILLEPVKPPIAFRALHTENFAEWNGQQHSEEFQKLQRAVERLVGQESGKSRTNDVTPLKPNILSSTKRLSPVVETSNESGQRFIEPGMVTIPAGSFQMGSIKDKYAQPVRTVTFIKPFMLGGSPVTFAEYDLFVGATGQRNPGDEGWGRGKRPVINVSWDDAIAYSQWLSAETGKRYRLPSEAEWEYAARAGTTGDYYWDDRDNAEDFAWFDINSKGKSHPVGEKQPSSFGLYDMSGNVGEWVQDCWHDNYQNAPTDGTAWEEKNSGNCSRRVLRGGSWFGDADYLRSASRSRLNPDSRDFDIGFRLAQDLS